MNRIEQAFFAVDVPCCQSHLPRMKVLWMSSRSEVTCLALGDRGVGA